MDRLMLRPEVEEVTGLDYTTIWKRMKENTFPRSVVIGKGPMARVAWRESEIQRWMDALPRQSFITDPGRELDEGAIRRREAGRKGGLKKAENIRKQKPRPRLRLPPGTL